MDLTWVPKTDDEILNLLEDGEYYFTIKTAEKGVSKTSGNPMITITLEIYDVAGREHYLKDWLVSAMEFKIKHLCYATGMKHKYDNGGCNAEDFIGKTGKCVIQINRKGDRPKNVIVDYLPIEEGKEAPKPALVDDDIKF